MTRNRPPFGDFNLIDLGLLTPHWRSSIDELVRASAKPVTLRGGSSTSLESTETVLEMELVTGDAIQESAPWLFHLYNEDLIPLAGEVAGQPVKPSALIKSSVNVNILKGTGSRYERHLDSNPLTGLLFVSRHEAHEGGQLVFEFPDETVSISPEPGRLLLFDARTVPHYVTPLTSSGIRITIPMNYFFVGDEEARPEDLDEHLYTS